MICVCPIGTSSEYTRIIIFKEVNINSLLCLKDGTFILSYGRKMYLTWNWEGNGLLVRYVLNNINSEWLTIFETWMSQCYRMQVNSLVITSWGTKVGEITIFGLCDLGKYQKTTDKLKTLKFIWDLWDDLFVKWKGLGSLHCEDLNSQDHSLSGSRFRE